MVHNNTNKSIHFSCTFRTNDVPSGLWLCVQSPSRLPILRRIHFTHRWTMRVCVCVCVVAVFFSFILCCSLHSIYWFDCSEYSIKRMAQLATIFSMHIKTTENAFWMLYISLHQTFYVYQVWSTNQHFPIRLFISRQTNHCLFLPFTKTNQCQQFQQYSPIFDVSNVNIPERLSIIRVWNNKLVAVAQTGMFTN